MATYALKVTLVDVAGAPIIRCWGPLFDTVNGVLSSPGWHQYVISFDSKIPRVQIAMDRGGGPVLGGGVMDTALGTGSLDVNNQFPTPSFTQGTNPQQMYCTLNAGNSGGFNATPGTLVDGPTVTWSFQPDQNTVTDLAYCYFSYATSFFDLRNSDNLNHFVSPSITPVDFGTAGSKIPLPGSWMHTGGRGRFAGLLGLPWAANVLYNFGDVASFGGWNWNSRVNNNVGIQPSLDPPNNAYWTFSTEQPQYQFIYNAINGTPWFGIVRDAPTQPPQGV